MKKYIVILLVCSVCAAVYAAQQFVLPDGSLSTTPRMDNENNIYVNTVLAPPVYGGTGIASMTVTSDGKLRVTDAAQAIDIAAIAAYFTTGGTGIISTTTAASSNRLNVRSSIYNSNGYYLYITDGGAALVSDDRYSGKVSTGTATKWITAPSSFSTSGYMSEVSFYNAGSSENIVYITGYSDTVYLPPGAATKISFPVPLQAAIGIASLAGGTTVYITTSEVK